MDSTDLKNCLDVAIIGGGLAGLTLSLQLKQRMPQLRVAVIERRAHPVVEAAHKVGESTVEIGAHYFEKTLGLNKYLQEKQLRKFGFRFFFSDGVEDIAKVTELGASTFLPTSSYQLDRGIFENDLAKMAFESGVEFVDQSIVREFSVGEQGQLHQLAYERAGLSERLTAKWLIDASGRAGLLKKRLGLAQANPHEANAIWFRMSERIDVGTWSDDANWRSRCNPPNRWLSTNHLMGKGYWAWLIPLVSGSHSIGIVADAKLHPIEQMNSFEKALSWLEIHQPKLAQEIAQRRDKLQDFAFFKRYSYGCRQVFDGASRWALTGEAGLFLDPFYSPGSDFIGISNSFITELIALDQQGAAVATYADIYEQIYFSLYQSMLPIYLDQYPLFGDPEVMPVKVIWDYTYYWGVMCQLFMQHKLTHIPTMGRLRKALDKVQAINVLVQEFLRDWHALSKQRNPVQLLDQAKLPWFVELNRSLGDTLDDAQFAKRMEGNLRQLELLAAQIVLRAQSEYPAINAINNQSPQAGQKILQLLNPGILEQANQMPEMLFV